MNEEELPSAILAHARKSDAYSQIQLKFIDQTMASAPDRALVYDAAMQQLMQDTVFLGRSTVSDDAVLKDAEQTLLKTRRRTYQPSPTRRKRAFAHLKTEAVHPKLGQAELVCSDVNKQYMRCGH